MTHEITENHDRLVELLVDRATEGLDAGDAETLDRLLAEADPGFDSDAFDRAATLVHLALLDANEVEPMPRHLRDRLRAVGADHVESTRSRDGAAGEPEPLMSDTYRFEAPAAEPPDSSNHPTSPASTRTAAAEARSVAWLPWLAAAACFIFALFAWMPRGTAAFDPAVAAARLAAREGTIVADWTGIENVSGDVVWHPETQTGFMRIRGLDVNDPSESQYQLWIFDERRPSEFPVEGGVFDIPPTDTASIDPVTGAVVIPIDASILVKEPALFAVTVEQPGGVMVSDRERIVATAPVNGQG